MQIPNCGLIFSKVETRKSMTFFAWNVIEPVRNRFIVHSKLFKIDFSPNLIFFSSFSSTKIANFFRATDKTFASPRKRTTMKEKRSNEVIISMPTPVNQIFSIMERETWWNFFILCSSKHFSHFPGSDFYFLSFYQFQTLSSTSVS